MQINTKKYGSAAFSFKKKALIKSLSPLDMTYATSVTKFEISGTQPENTERRIIFKIDDVLYRFVNSVLDPYIWRGDVEDILKYGNTVADLMELDNVNAFKGKKIFPIVALSAPADSDVFPKIKIALKWQTYDDLYTVYKYSPILELKGEKPRITSIKKEFTTTGNATEITECRFKKLTEDWTDWAHYLSAENQIASEIQFRTKFVVTTLDETDSAAIDSIKVDYIADADKSAADERVFFTKLENYDADLKTCYLLIKHKPNINSTFKAYVSMVPLSDRRENILLGTTSGDVQAFALPNDFIKQDTLHVELDGVPTFDFDFDTNLSTISLQADAGQTVSVSYEFFHAEDWQEMFYDTADDEKTRFTFRTLQNNLQEVLVKFSVVSHEGVADDVPVDIGDGKKHVYALDGLTDDIKVTKFSCNVPHKLKGGILEAVAAIDQPVNVSYKWKGTLPQIDSYIAGFAV